MTLSVILVSYHTGPALKECVASVCGDALVDELILVDNGNSPLTRQWLDDLSISDKTLTILRGQGNVGFAKACNMAAKVAQGTHLLFLNPDAVLQTGTLAALLETLEAAPSGSLVGARLLNTDGSEQRGARRGRLTPWSALVSMTGLTRFAHLNPAFNDLHQEHQPLPDTPIAVHAVSGACMMMRTQDFAALNGFDEQYFLHVEDLDLCRRVRKTGGEVIFVPHAEVIHYGSTSKANRLLVDGYKATGLVRYFVKFSHSPVEWLGAWVLAIPILGAVMLRSLFITLKER
jgi:N-acetylglucosaminyl-diphospho-decaprenol L-rhamnosyltransferase